MHFHILTAFFPIKPLSFPVMVFGGYMPTSRIAEKAMASHSSTLAWKIPWMEEPGRL